ncbi:hypothetical protein [Pseudomonas amygdali]|uniref:Uncharacterized protein n=2 Tax=Pseudomonas amygdali pv. lachrymans TaxID=53707 RepID=A0ABR5KR06_PSEAV|nr:hypothetical protein [Pseudomonas amygdali]AXH59784.1 hypothetical protein PLA107_031670 [Pseudomonas amygdali pv. lachrymans str. M301315]KPC17203.1 Uncharacterized protein AC499_0405 [Pseudomonas amygdali pv. lachrymans]KPC18162.1 Uncharacterized protein AC499_1364 [Pseudomonas amygdali pv. lachrymans]RMT06483.1 hypothetical protein ALP54_03678 [Pseudomonas amygdali pv. lachrymans]
MLSVYGYEVEHSGDLDAVFAAISPEGLSVHFLHSAEKGAFMIAIHRTYPRLVIASGEDFVLRHFPRHVDMIASIEALFAQDLERIRCSGLAQARIENAIKNSSDQISVSASAFGSAYPDFSASLLAMSERVYSMKCEASANLTSSYAQASAAMEQLSAEYDAKKTRH